MKNILRGITFWTIVIGFILFMTTIGQALASVVSMNFVMTAVYVTLGCSFIYIFKR